MLCSAFANSTTTTITETLNSAHYTTHVTQDGKVIATKDSVSFQAKTIIATEVSEPK